MDPITVDPDSVNKKLANKCRVIRTSNPLAQIAAASAASLGSVALGLNLGWSSPVQLQLVFNSTDYSTSDYLVLNAEQWSWVVSLLTLGALIGSLLSGPVIDLVGRKNGLMLATIPYMIGWILITLATNPMMLYIGRIFNGIGGGFCSVATPTYIVEMSTPRIRGRLGILYHMTIVIGTWLCNVVGLKLDDRLAEDWRWISIICAFAPLFLAIGMIFVPETPYWLLKTGQRHEAARSLRWSRGEDYDVEFELIQLEASIKAQNTTATFSDLFGWWALKPFLVSLAVLLFHQTSGINIVLFYMAGIFEDAGSELPPLMSSFICNSVRVVIAMLAVILVDRTGRRFLMLTSSIMSTIGMFALGAYYYLNEHSTEIAKSVTWLPLTSMIIFIAGFALGLGPLPWLIMSEILPRKIKGPANSIASSFNWTLSFVITKTFVDVQQSLTMAGVYWLFGAFCLVAVVFTLTFLPETKGKTYDEIQAHFGNSET